MSTDDPSPQEMGHAYLFSRLGWTDGEYASGHLGQGDYSMRDVDGVTRFVEFKDLRPESDLETLAFRTEKSIQKMDRQAASGMDIAHELSVNAYRANVTDEEVREFGEAIADELSARESSPIDRLYLWSGEDRLDPKLSTFEIDAPLTAPPEPEADPVVEVSYMFGDDLVELAAPAVVEFESAAHVHIADHDQGIDSPEAPSV